MDEPGARLTPTIAFLESVEQRFSVRYPRQYKALCCDSDRTNPSLAALLAGGVELICDLKKLQAVNVKLGAMMDEAVVPATLIRRAIGG